MTFRYKISTYFIAISCSLIAGPTTWAADGEKAEAMSRTALEEEYKHLNDLRLKLSSEQTSLSNYVSIVSNTLDQLERASFPSNPAAPSILSVHSAFIELTNFESDVAFRAAFSERFARLRDYIDRLAYNLQAPLLRIIDPLGNRRAIPPGDEVLFELYQNAMASVETRRYRGVYRSGGELAPALSELGSNPSWSDFTNSLKTVAAELSTRSLLEKAQTYFTRSKETMVSAVQKLRDSIQPAIKLREDQLKPIQEKMKAVDAQLRALDQGQQSINAKLVWTIYAVILAIVLIYLFLVAGRPAISHHLIESRLVIELATMAFLLQTIIVLGLSDKLDKTSLGTLIGAIAGYLLARQGRGSQKKQITPLPGALEIASMPGAMEIASVTPQAGGHFQISYPKTGGENATTLNLQWLVEGADHDFGHDTAVVRGGQTVATGAVGGQRVRFRTVATNNTGTVQSSERSVMAI